MGYHAILESSNISVYRQSDCASDSQVGTLYNGEVFTFIKEHNGYFGHYEIRFLTSSGEYANGFIDTGSGFGNLAYSGQSVTESNLGSTKCYRFKLRKALNVVKTNGTSLTSLSAGDYVYTRGATAGASNPRNMYICGYKKDPDPLLPVTHLLLLITQVDLCSQGISVYIKLNASYNNLVSYFKMHL